MPVCRSAWAAGIGPNRKARALELTNASYQARDIPCLVPINLRRIGGASEEIDRRRAALPNRFREMTTEAIDRAYYDLQQPIEHHRKHPSKTTDVLIA